MARKISKRIFLRSRFNGSVGSVTMRRVGHATDNSIFHIVGDHLGSSSVIVQQDGTPSSYHYYYPFGGNRGGLLSPLTTKRYTGQYHEEGLPGGEGLSYYGARWYDAQVGKFTSADLLVPEPANPLTLNRFAYVMNNPLLYSDPSGHVPCTLVCSTPLRTDNLDAGGLRHLGSDAVALAVTQTVVATAVTVATVASAASLIGPADAKMIGGGFGAVSSPPSSESFPLMKDGGNTVSEFPLAQRGARELISDPPVPVSGWREEFPLVRRTLQDYIASVQLRRNFRLTAGSPWQAHHVIPTAVASNNALVRLARQAGWDNDATYNGILLPNNSERGRLWNLPYHRALCAIMDETTSYKRLT